MSGKYVGCDSRSDWHSPELAALVAANAIPREPVLDLGCGHGTEALFLASWGFRVTAFDTNRAAIAAAKQRKRQLPASARARVQFFQRSALALPRSLRATFGAVVERLLFVNLRATQQTQLLMTAAAALRAGGVFVLRLGVDGPVGWGKLPRSGFFRRSQVRLFEDLFDGPPRIVGFTGIVTDPTLTDDSLIQRGNPQCIVFAVRNDARPRL